jgi:hypothetical protein
MSVYRVAWRLLWQGVFGGAFLGLAAAFFVTWLAQGLALVAANESPPGTYILWGVVWVVWFLATFITTNRNVQSSFSSMKDELSTGG